MIRYFFVTTFLCVMVVLLAITVGTANAQGYYPQYYHHHHHYAQVSPGMPCGVPVTTGIWVTQYDAWGNPIRVYVPVVTMQPQFGVGQMPSNYYGYGNNGYYYPQQTRQNYAGSRRYNGQRNRQQRAWQRQ